MGLIPKFGMLFAMLCDLAICINACQISVAMRCFSLCVPAYMPTLTVMPPALIVRPLLPFAELLVAVGTDAALLTPAGRLTDDCVLLTLIVPFAFPMSALVA